MRMRNHEMWLDPLLQGGLGTWVVVSLTTSTYIVDVV